MNVNYIIFCILHSKLTFCVVHPDKLERGSLFGSASQLSQTNNSNDASASNKVPIRKSVSHS